MSKAEDAGDYYRIPADNRDLNYAKYFTEGQEDISKYSDYTSHNAEQLNSDDLKNLILGIGLTKEDMSA